MVKKFTINNLIEDIQKGFLRWELEMDDYGQVTMTCNGPKYMAQISLGGWWHKIKIAHKRTPVIVQEINCFRFSRGFKRLLNTKPKRYGETLSYGLYS